MDLAVAERRHQREHVPHLVQHPERAQVFLVADAGAVGAAVAAQVGGHDVVALCREGRHQAPPAVGELGEAVQQQHAPTRAGLRPGLQHVHADGVDAGDEAGADAGRQHAVRVRSDVVSLRGHVHGRRGVRSRRGDGDPGGGALQELASRERGVAHRPDYATSARCRRTGPSRTAPRLVNAAPLPPLEPPGSLRRTPAASRRRQRCCGKPPPTGVHVDSARPPAANATTMAVSHRTDGTRRRRLVSVAAQQVNAHRAPQQRQPGVAARPPPTGVQVDSAWPPAANATTMSHRTDGTRRRRLVQRHS